MVSLFQVLTIAGLLFEFLSVFITVWTVFLPWRSWYNKRIKWVFPTLKDEYKEQRKTAIIVLTLLVIGMLFQVIAVLLPSEWNFQI
jgi:hypothetical protein